MALLIPVLIAADPEPRQVSTPGTIWFLRPRLKESDPDDLAQPRCLHPRRPRTLLPHRDHGPRASAESETKAVCRQCEVVETCLKWAIASDQDAGIWGGLSGDERRAFKRRNARARRNAARMWPGVVPVSS